jgi:hypothetical protein
MNFGDVMDNEKNLDALLRQVIYFWLKWVSKSADVAIQPFDGSTI